MNENSDPPGSAFNWGVSLLETGEVETAAIILNDAAQEKTLTSATTTATIAKSDVRGRRTMTGVLTQNGLNGASAKGGSSSSDAKAPPHLLLRLPPSLVAGLLLRLPPSLVAGQQP